MEQQRAKNSALKKMGQGLFNILKNSVIFVTFFFGVIIGKTYIALPPSVEKEKLALTEKKYLKSIFGDAINTEHLQKRKIIEPFGDDRQAAFVIGFEKNNIRFVDDVYEDDFTKGTSENILTLTHEANHIAENQKRGYHGMLSHIFMNAVRIFTRGYNIDHEYNYTLENGKPFDAYGTEQRASIVESYAETFILPYMKDVKDVYLYKVDDNQLLLRKTVETKYPQAKITREKLEKENQMIADLIYGRTKITLASLPSINQTP